MSDLFKPGDIGTMRLKNRIVRSATEEWLATNEGRVTDEYLHHYTRLAKGGVGLIITGNYGINILGRAGPHTMLADRDEAIGDLQKVVETVHENGAKIVAQLNHAGRQRHPETDDKTPVAPSAVRVKLTRVMPHAMTEGEIQDTIADFGEAARRIKEAGFDGVQIHGAYGYLVNQFRSRYTNRRTDNWGGSAENRSRFLFEVYKAIRDAVGSGYPVLIKINAVDGVAGGITLDETITACRELDKLGVDAIEVAGGIDELIKGGIPTDIVLRNFGVLQRILFRLLIERSLKKNARCEEGFHLSGAVAVRKNVQVPVIAVGGIRRRAMMHQILKSGQADYVSLSRPFIRQPNLVNQLEKEDADPISCISCNRCVFEMIVHSNPVRCRHTKTAA